MRSGRLVTIAVAALLLGCANGDSKADDKPDPTKDEKKDEKPDEKKPDEKKPPGDTGAGKTDDKKDERPDVPASQPRDKDAKDTRKYVAKVTDRTKTTKEFTIGDAEVFVPEVSLLGGEGGKREKKIVVKHGPADIEVPFSEIAKVQFKDVKDDRLEVIIVFKNPERAGKELVGTVKSNLQLVGFFEKSQLNAKIKLREVLEITVDEAK